MQVIMGKNYRLVFKGRSDRHATVIPSCWAISADTVDGLTIYLFRIAKSLTTIKVVNTSITSLDPVE